MLAQPISTTQKNQMLDSTIGELLKEYPNGFSYFSYCQDHIYDAVVEPAGTYRAYLIISNRDHGICRSIITDHGIKLSQLDENVESIVEHIADA